MAFINNPANTVQIQNFPSTQDVNVTSVDPSVEVFVKPVAENAPLNEATLLVDETASVVVIAANADRNRVLVTNSGEVGAAGPVFVCLSATAINPATATPAELASIGAHILYPGGSWLVEGHLGVISAIASSALPAFVAVTEW